MNKNFITITGIDERTDLNSFEQLSKQYCDILEVGILYSAEPQNFSFHRYPRLEWILENSTRFPNRSIHICGKKAKNQFLNHNIDNSFKSFFGKHILEIIRG